MTISQKDPRIEIRRKQYDFRAAPDLSGQTDAGYVPVLLLGAFTGDNPIPRLTKNGARFGRAIDAAKEAARMCEAALAAGRISERCAFVRCDYKGVRPPGAMKGYVYVSYRVRH